MMEEEKLCVYNAKCTRYTADLLIPLPSIVHPRFVRPFYFRFSFFSSSERIEFSGSFSTIALLVSEMQYFTYYLIHLQPILSGEMDFRIQFTGYATLKVSVA